MTTEPTARTTWRARRAAVIGGVFVVGAVAFAVAAIVAFGARDSHASSAWRIVLAVALFAVGEALVLHLRFGSDRYTVTWSETMLVIALVIAPWPWVTLAGTAGAVLAHAMARREPLKIVFNTACTAASSAAAAGVAYVVLGTTDVSTVPEVRAAAGLAVAATVFFVCNSIMVSAVIATVRQLSVRAVFADGIYLKLGVLAGNTVIALLLVGAPWRGSVIVLVPFCVLALFFAYRGYHQAIEEGAIWKQLDDAAKELRVLDGADVARAAVRRAVHLFGAEFAELTAPVSADGEPEVFRADLPGADAHSDSNTPFDGWVVDTPLAIATGRDVTVHDATIGSLRLGFRGTSTMSERQRQVLRTYTHTIATSLQNARLYREMQHQAAVSAYEATRDPLTGIPNRKRLTTVMGEALVRAEGNRDGVSLLLVDLDHFKEINDTLGHHAGDAVLCAVAAKLSEVVRPIDLVARLGGDEFALLLADINDASYAETVAQRVLTVLGEPIGYEGLQLAVGASIGVSCFPQDGGNSEDLLRCADMALYQAKRPRGAISRYRSELDDHSVSKITLAAELRAAIDGNQFMLMFQPQVDLVSEQLIGAEALTRWQHPDRGLLGPVDFIDMVERSGLIRQFTLYVIERAVQAAAAWRAHGALHPVSVNLSARNLLDPDLPGDVAVILARHGLRGDQLILEITETTMVSDVRTVESNLTRLRRVGVQLSIDDFGTGYSSLAFLQRNAVNEIKIDKSFVIAMMHSENDAAIVRATVELAHGLGVRVIAEGVETAEHVTALRALGCDGAQGWHYGRPGPPERFWARPAERTERGAHRPVVTRTMRDSPARRLTHPSHSAPVAPALGTER